MNNFRFRFTLTLKEVNFFLFLEDLSTLYKLFNLILLMSRLCAGCFICLFLIFTKIL